MFTQQLTPQCLPLSRLFVKHKNTNLNKTSSSPLRNSWSSGKDRLNNYYILCCMALMGWVGGGGEQWMPWEQRKSTYPTFAKSKSAGLPGGGDIQIQMVSTIRQSPPLPVITGCHLFNIDSVLKILLGHQQFMFTIQKVKVDILIIHMINQKTEGVFYKEN